MLSHLGPTWKTANLVAQRLLNSDIITRDNLPEEDYDALIALLPAEFIVYRTTTDVSGEDPKPQINPELYECVFFKEAVRNFQNDLGAGKYEPAYISKGKEARRKRLAGDFDSWKDAQFELHWGDKQRLYSEAIAGESSKIRLITLIKHHQFRVGDVFSMRRGFFGGATVRKDAVVSPYSHKNL